MSARHGILTVTRRSLQACELPDGTLTLDKHTAVAARQRAEDLKFEEEEFNQNLARARAATPNRVDHLWTCLDRKLISHKAAFELVKTGRITDRGWEDLRDLLDNPDAPRRAPDLATRFKMVLCWTAEFETSSGAREVAFDPLENRERGFPWTAVARLLDDVGNDGWRVVHVSEDRGVDDSADVSFLVAARFVLAQ
jgi:hypothetical protein